jgi:hypothetical protein
VFDWDNPHRIFLATTGNQVFFSQDGGANWRQIL